MQIKSACYTAAKRLKDGGYLQQSVSISRGSNDFTGLPEVVIAIEGVVISRFDADSLELWADRRGNYSFCQAELEGLSLAIYGDDEHALSLGKRLGDFVGVWNPRFANI